MIIALNSEGVHLLKSFQNILHIALQKSVYIPTSSRDLALTSQPCSTWWYHAFDLGQVKIKMKGGGR